jgi:small-conductance mechanosensitive channel
LLTNFAGGALNFELRAWTGHSNDWSQVRSDLSVAISSALTAQNISIR